MARAPRSPRPRSRRACNGGPGLEPEPGPGPGASDRGPSGPARRPRRRLRSPTSRAGRRAAPPGPHRPGSEAAQRAAPPGPLASSNRGTLGCAAGAGGAARSTEPIPGAGSGKAEALEAGMEQGATKRLSSAASLEGDRSAENNLKRDSASSPTLDRYKIARQLTEKAIKEKKIFSICGHYPVIRAALRRKGWVEKKFQLQPKVISDVEDEENKCVVVKENQEMALEKTDDIHDVMSRLVKNEMPYFLWTIKRDVIDYHSLSCDQMLNHFGKTASFTTKIGLCVNMRSLPWYAQANPDSFFPRCYGLCTESEKLEFLADFRRTMASSILKWVVSHQSYTRSKLRSRREDAGNSDLGNKRGIASSNEQLQFKLFYASTGSCGGFSSDPENAEAQPRGISGQLVDTACRVCQTYLGQLEHEDIDVSEETTEGLTEAEWKDLTQQYYTLVHGDAFISNSRHYFSQCQALLNKLTSVNPQMGIDGLRNIWIIKPAAKSRGRDIVCMDRVEDILQLVATDNPPSKENKWVVQKYIETPMLIYDTKFDIRQWFLVTDWNPLTIWFYKESYLRFSTQRFSLDSLDSAIHLCNNSIQKHFKTDKERSPLLPGHNMWTSSRFQEYLQKMGCGALWGNVIYPSMKRAIAHTMKVAQGHVEARKNSFELYGADFILGRDFKPWLIEINSSPTMHPSTPVTAQLCAQVQEDIIKVVVDRRLNRNCDIGNFELLWRQPTVELPPFSVSDLCVEGVSVRRARRPTPPMPGSRPSTLLADMWPPRVPWPSALPASACRPSRAALQPDLKPGAGRVLPFTLPVPLKTLAGRGCGGKTELPAGNCQHADDKAPKTGVTKAQSTKLLDADILNMHPLAPVPPSVKAAEGSLSQPPRARALPRALPAPCLLCGGSLPSARPCKRCRSFCASVLQGASFVPLGGGRGASQWTP